MDADAVEAIGNVNFDQLNGSMSWVGKNKVAKQARQGISKLHGIMGGNRNSLTIEAKKGVVDNGARVAVMLGNAAHGADTKIWKVLDRVKG